jgi:hypothetical protein
MLCTIVFIASFYAAYKIEVYKHNRRFKREHKFQKKRGHPIIPRNKLS